MNESRGRKISDSWSGKVREKRKEIRENQQKEKKEGA